MPLFSPAQQQALQAAVEDAYDADGLGQLAKYRLGQRLDVLVAVNRPFGDVAFDLIAAVEARGWTEEFVRGVHDDRPQNPLVAAFCQAHAPFVFTPRTAANVLAQTVGAGLATIAGRLAGDPGDPARQEMVGQAAKTLAALEGQFTRLRKYKALHDCLHTLQFKYARAIPAELKLMPGDPEAAANLHVYFQEMAEDLGDARPAADGLASQAAEGMWLAAAEESVRRMRAAVAAADPAGAAAGFKLLEGVLRVQPTRINELLAAVLEHLALADLRAVLLRLAAGPDDGVGRAAAALGTLAPRLAGILADHKEWQLVDNALHQIDTEFRLGSDVTLGAYLWAETDKLLGRMLDRDRAAPWAVELRDLAAALTTAFAAAAPAGVRPAFKRLLPRAMWYFYQADKELKALSGELDAVGDRLRDILREVGGDSN